MSGTRTIDRLEDNEYFEYKGDVHVTGDIGKNVTVKITDGSLTVDGSIDDNSDVTLESKQKNNIVVSSGVFFSSSVVSVGGSSGKDINVKGNVGNNVNFNSHSSSYTVEGSVTYNGSVYENGVKRKNEKSQSGSVSIGGMTFIGSGRIIVNGQDITNLVNQASSKKEVKEEPPVRYRKGF